MSTPIEAVERAPSGTPRTGTLTRANNRRTWALGVLAAVLLLAVAGWVNHFVERSLADEVRGSLVAIRDSQAEALRNWVRSQIRVAEAAAQDDDVWKSLLSLSEDRARLQPGQSLRLQLLESPHQARLRQRLSLLSKGLGVVGFGVVGPRGTILTAHDDAWLAKVFPAPIVREQKSGWFVPPQPVAFSDVERPLMMLVFAPIWLEGRLAGALYLQLDPTQDFSLIAQRGRMGETGETYAFSKDGHLLTESRFAPSLRSIGLLGAASPSAIWEVQLRDPGGNLVSGYRSSSALADQPLTMLAQGAARDSIGVNVSSYNDYRGVPVVGAWKRLDDLGFSVGTEIDVSEAFALRDSLQLAFLALLVGLTLTLAGVVAATHVVGRLQRKAISAELRATKLGQYKLNRKLGEGGMGIVYEGQHEMLRRRTAIKLLKLDEASSKREQEEARFQREAQATSQLTHPNTIAVYDYGKTADGTFYYAMEYLDGVNLDRLVQRAGPLPASRVIHFMLQACSSLAEAHAAGMVHRDIKPGNMMTCERGGVPDTLKVLDFGLVSSWNGNDGTKLTAVGTLMGTPHYLAPEVIKEPEQASALSDIYALGGTMYFLATGHDVFEKSNATAICMAHLMDAPAPMSSRTSLPIPFDFEQVVMQCLAKDPAERPSSVRALANALRRCTDAGAWSLESAEAWWLANGSSVSGPAVPVPTGFSATIPSVLPLGDG